MSDLHALYVRVPSDSTPSGLQAYRLTDYVEFGLVQSMYQAVQPFAATDDLTFVHIGSVGHNYDARIVDFVVRSQTDPSVSRAPRLSECVLRRYSKRGYTTKTAAVQAWNRVTGRKYRGATGGWIYSTNPTVTKPLIQGWEALAQRLHGDRFWYLAPVDHAKPGAPLMFHYLIERVGDPFSAPVKRWHDREANAAAAATITSACVDCGQDVPTLRTGEGWPDLPRCPETKSQHQRGHRVPRDAFDYAVKVRDGYAVLGQPVQV